MNQELRVFDLERATLREGEWASGRVGEWASGRFGDPAAKPDVNILSFLPSPLLSLAKSPLRSSTPAAGGEAFLSRRSAGQIIPLLLFV